MFIKAPGDLPKHFLTFPARQEEIKDPNLILSYLRSALHWTLVPWNIFPKFRSNPYFISQLICHSQQEHELPFNSLPNSAMYKFAKLQSSSSASSASQTLETSSHTDSFPYTNMVCKSKIMGKTNFLILSKSPKSSFLWGQNLLIQSAAYMHQWIR